MAPEFPHRTNPDGTIDSICLRCFAMVANSYWEVELERMEAAHICDPVQLAYIEEARRSGAKWPPDIESSPKVKPIKRAS